MDVPMKVIQCANCHVPFAIPSRLEEDRRRDHKSFYCPNGHSQFFPGKSDEEVLKEQLKQKEKQISDKSNVLAEAQAAMQRERDQRIKLVNALLEEQFKNGKKGLGIALKFIAPKLGMKTNELISFLKTNSTGMVLSRSGKGWMVLKKKTSNKGDK